MGAIQIDIPVPRPQRLACDGVGHAGLRLPVGKENIFHRFMDSIPSVVRMHAAIKTRDVIHRKQGRALRPLQLVRNDARRSKDRFPFFAVDGVVVPFGALRVDAMPGAAISEDRPVNPGNDPARVLPAPKPFSQRLRGDAVAGRETRSIPNKQT